MIYTSTGLGHLSADGVARGPGGIMVYRLSAGTQNLTMQDGKPTGWTSSGKGTYPVAGGNMATVAGKSFRGPLAPPDRAAM